MTEQMEQAKAALHAEAETLFKQTYSAFETNADIQVFGTDRDQVPEGGDPNAIPTRNKGRGGYGLTYVGRRGKAPEKIKIQVSNEEKIDEWFSDNNYLRSLDPRTVCHPFKVQLIATSTYLLFTGEKRSVIY